MFLKSYTELSDSGLTDNINSNIHHQLFCGVRINPLYPLTNFKIVSAIRCEIASLLKIDDLQSVLASYWKPYMDNTQILMSDATCYVSYIRYPTDIKLLWEAVEWLYHHMCCICKSLKLRKPRCKYDKQSKRYHSSGKKRKRGQTETRVLKRSLLHLLNKLIGLTDDVLMQYAKRLQLGSRFRKRYAVIRKVCTQQQLKFEGHVK